MQDIIVRTYPFAHKVAQKELSKFTRRKVNTFSNEGEFIISFDDFEEGNNFEVSEFLGNILYYSRMIQKVFLIDESGEEFDLFGFDLSKREHKINDDKVTKMDPILVNYCLYLLGIDELEDKWSIIDPTSSLGDVIIESAIFNPRHPLNVRKRLRVPFVEYFGEIPAIPNKQVDKNKYIGIVQDNVVFKNLKENINYLDVKIKMSQYELDWLDVKFKKGEVDYVFSFLPDFEEEEEYLEFQKEFFYQAEFICEKSICVICYEELSKKILNKFGLKIDYKEEVVFDEDEWYLVYIISKK